MYFKHNYYYYSYYSSKKITEIYSVSEDRASVVARDVTVRALLRLLFLLAAVTVDL